MSRRNNVSKANLDAEVSRPARISSREIFKVNKRPLSPKKDCGLVIKLVEPGGIEPPTY